MDPALPLKLSHHLVHIHNILHYPLEEFPPTPCLALVQERKMAKASNMKGYNAPSSLQCIAFCVIALPLLYWTVYGLIPSQEPVMPLDCLHGFVFLLMYLCSNSAFLLLFCNVLIGALLFLSKPTETHDFDRPYLKQSEGRRNQAVVAEPLWIEKKGDIHEHGVVECTHMWRCSIENVRKPETGGEDCCGEEKSIWVSSLAVVPYQESAQADISSEELNRRCDEFIANFRRQMSLQGRR